MQACLPDMPAHTVSFSTGELVQVSTNHNRNLPGRFGSSCCPEEEEGSAEMSLKLLRVGFLDSPVKDAMKDPAVISREDRLDEL